MTCSLTGSALLQCIFYTFSIFDLANLFPRSQAMSLGFTVLMRFLHISLFGSFLIEPLR